MAMVKICCTVYVTRLMQPQMETLTVWSVLHASMVPNINICVILYIFNLLVLYTPAVFFPPFTPHIRLLHQTDRGIFGMYLVSIRSSPKSAPLLVPNAPLIHHTPLSPHENTHGSLTGLENGNHTASCPRDSRSVPKPSGLPCCLPPT